MPAAKLDKHLKTRTLNNKNGREALFMAGTRKIKRISVADQVYEELKNLILNETWKVGERIPTETQLASQFEVNRLTVRLALQRLQALGLLDIRVGDGTYVKAFDMNSSITDLAVFYTENISPEAAREYRYIIEMACIKLAVERRTEEDLALYLSKCDEMRSHVEEYHRSEDHRSADEELNLQTDLSMEIHTIICSMAHNELLNYAFSMARASNRQLMLRNIIARIADPESASETLGLYDQLYSFLEQRDPEKSRECLKKIMNLDINEKYQVP